MKTTLKNVIQVNDFLPTGKGIHNSLTRFRVLGILRPNTEIKLGSKMKGVVPVFAALLRHQTLLLQYPHRDLGFEIWVRLAMKLWCESVKHWCGVAVLQGQ